MTAERHLHYPAISDLEKKARQRIPHFAWEYLDSGTGEEECLQRNRAVFKDVTLTPQFMQGEFEPDIRCALFGKEYHTPFGIAPIGLTGLMWPQAEKFLARSAAHYRVPYTLSTLATESPETIGALADEMGWFQLYPPKRAEIRRDLLARAQASGFTTLLVTADVPVSSRRERQLRAGVSVPPRTNLRTLYHAAIRPSWSLATLSYGLPRFRGLEKYLETSDMQQMVSFFGKEFGGTLDWDYLKAVREEWRGPIILKGVLCAEQAKRAAEIGLDGVVVSNHGGRQFDGAPAALSVLPEIKAVAGKHLAVLFDSGLHTGLDIAKALALGADFVLLGRAFMYGVAALGEEGGDHVIEILSDDLRNNMAQLGCRTIDDLPQYLRDCL